MRDARDARDARRVKSRERWSLPALLSRVALGFLGE